MTSFLPVVLLAFLAQAQTPSGAVAPADVPAASGISAAWDVSRSVESLSMQASRLKPILDEMKPQEWVSRGAPSAYLDQWNSAQVYLTSVVDAARSLEKQPERLTVALDTYFRMQSLEQMLNSLVDAVRRYQDPAIGEQLIRVFASNGPNRDALRQYITDLAGTKEQEFQIADKEAQRCRTELLRQPPPPRPAPRRAAPAKPPAKPADVKAPENKPPEQKDPK